jgi:cellulose synthase operon protein C
MNPEENQRDSQAPPARRTMPPPELLDRSAPDSVGELVLEDLQHELPVSRHTGPHAEEELLRARVEDARLAGDAVTEREAAIALASLLAGRGRDLGLATKLARRALVLADEPALRSELAGWLAGLGDDALAAATLRGLCGPDNPAETARTLVMIAVLLARADDAAGAVDALREAAEVDPGDVTALEMVGTFAAWSPATVSPEQAADAYLAVAARRDAAAGEDDKEAALEDRLRAFEAAPEHQGAAVALAMAFAGAGRSGAADEVLRAHAAAVAKSRDEAPGDEQLLAAAREADVHHARMIAALREGDPTRAVAAALDGAFEGDVDGEDAGKVDEALSAAGLDVIVAARREVAAMAAAGRDESEALGDAVRKLAEAKLDPAAAARALVLAARRTSEHPRARAEALSRLAGALPQTLRATLLAVAAEIAMKAGFPEIAREHATAACEADPGGVRAVAALASLAGGHEDRLGAATLERAMALALPRGAACARLAEVHEARGEGQLALTWTQRWLSLRPGSREAMAELLRRAAALGDAARLVDALSWVLSQPLPLTEMVAPVAAAIEALAGNDRSKARALARRALDVIGPRDEGLRERLLALAERLNDSGLAIAVLERHAAHAIGGAPGDDAVATLLALAARRRDAGDLDGAARSIARAAEAHAPPDAVLAQLRALDEARGSLSAALSSDGQIAAAEARAAALADVVRAEGRSLHPPQPRRRAVRGSGPRARMRRPSLQRAETALPAEPPEQGEPPAGAPRGAEDALPAVDLPEPMSMADGVLGAASNAYRELGSLRWDLAADHRGAEEDFFRAAELLPRGGVQRYARDLYAFAGLDAAIEALALRARRVTGEGAHRVRASLLIEAANLANTHGRAESALVAAASAIESDPSRADAIALVEKNAGAPGGLPILDQTYDLLAAAAMGRYGRRAAHYRGARQLERRGAVDLALRHAAACFEAVPTEGTSYVLLARLAERAGDPGEAVRALERVAVGSPKETRTLWLVRAAQLAGKNEEGARTRLDLLLQALALRPDRSIVDLVGKALRELSVLASEDFAARLRFARALRASLPRLDGPDGARAAVGMARLAMEFGEHELAFAALTRAMNVDGDVDEFAELYPMISDLIGESEGEGGNRGAHEALAEQWIAGVRATAERPYSNVGAALLQLASRLAAALGDARASVVLLVQAVGRAPDDDALVDDADVAVAMLGDAELERRLAAALPMARRVEALLRVAERHEREGHFDPAITALDRAITSGELGPEARSRAVLRLRTLLVEADRADDAEAMLEAELERDDLTAEARAAAARELAESLGRRGEGLAAADVLAAAARRGAATPDLLTDLRALVRSTGDPRRHAEVLTEILGLLPEGKARLPILHELAPIARERGDHAVAFAYYEEISRIDPADAEALEVLERDANDRGDHETIAALLARRIGSVPAGDRRRMLRLRRAAVLEQRLGRLEEAAAELTELLDESPDDVSALRFLADIQDRLGAKVAAGALLRHLGDLSPTSDEKADYGLRAASAYLSGSDLDTAEQILEGIAPVAEREAVLEIRVELARRRGDGRALSEELDRLAACSREPADRRAAILLDAARVASSIGDDAAALDRARRAVKLAPGLPEAVLESRRLEYRAGGAGTPREAQGAVDDLTRIASRISPAQVELHAFLLAEELDVIQGGGAGMRELSRRHAEVGPLPLVVLGMAERLVRSKNFEAALPLFEQALAGNLRGLRSRGRVALAGAEAAISVEDFEATERLLAAAAAEPDTAVLALRKQLELTGLRGEPSQAARALEELIRQTTGEGRARAMLQLGRLRASASPETAARLFAEAAALAAGDKALSAQIAQAMKSGAGSPRAPESRDAELSARGVNAGSPPSARAMNAGAPPSGRGAPAPAALVAPIPPTPEPAISPPPASARAAAAKGAERQPAAPAPIAGPAPSPQSALGAVPLVARPLPAAGPPPLPVAGPPPLPVVTPAEKASAAESHRGAPRIRAVIAPMGNRLPPPPRMPSLSDDGAPLSLSPQSESGSIAPALPAAAGDEGLEGEGFVGHELESAGLEGDGGDGAEVESSELEPDDAPGAPPLAAALDASDASDASDAISPRDASPALAAVEHDDEVDLLHALAAGSFEAGEQIVARYGARSADRSHDVLNVRRQQAAIRPGDPLVLRRLHEAALLDGNTVYARALQHVLALVDPTSTFPQVPALAGQRLAPERVSALLFRHVAESRVHEALSIVLETGLYRRDMAQYHLTGVTRVQPGAATVLGDVLGTVGRFLGQGRTALFHVRASNPTGAKIALLAPPAIILSGDIREETPELRYLLGASLTGAMPEHALVNALNEEALRTLIDALQAAFGPVANLPRGNAAVARLGQNLWQLVPPRADRRLRELCVNPELITYEAAVGGTRQAMRRAGLFAVGALSTVLKLVAFEHSFQLPRATLPSGAPSSNDMLLLPDALTQICEAHAVAADLYRLAISTEFAEARWLPAAAPERRRPEAGTRSRVGSSG